MIQYIETLYTTADTAHCDGDLDSALSYYQQILAIDSTHYESLRWSADIYLEKSAWQSAIDMFTRAYTIHDADADMLNDFALCYYENDDYENAVTYYKHAMYHNPDLEVAHRNFGIALYELYRENKPLAIENAQWWRRHFPNNPQAQVMVAAVMGENIADQNPDYVQGVFDDFAEDFEQKLQDLNYKAPDYIHDSIIAHVKNTPVAHILDVGCGTGLVGDKINHLTHTLTGIDLSAEMLKIAENKQIYNTLHQSDLVTFLTDKHHIYDGIVAGDVLCYFGDLQPVLGQFYNALMASGTLIFTVEYNPEQPFLLTPSGRYTHDKTHTQHLLHHTGFTTVHIQQRILRTEHSKNVNGLVVTAHK